MPIGKTESVRLKAFAKVNLCLHVLGRRPDNYHELRTIFQTNLAARHAESFAHTAAGNYSRNG